MGQAAKDLPATSDVQADAAAPVADDLLAQLAGEDIDRMLAEADVETAAAAAAAPVESAALYSANSSSISSVSSADADDLAGGLDELHKEAQGELDAKESLSASPVAIASEPVPAAVEKQAVEELPPERESSGEPAKSSETQVVAQSAEIPKNTANTGASAKSDVARNDAPLAPSPATKASDPSVSEPAAANTASEKTAPNAEGAEAGEAEDDDDSLPFYVRFLEFVNSPLDAFPDFVREIIGKIALVTLINSIAVIGYVLLFRKK